MGMRLDWMKISFHYIASILSIETTKDLCTLIKAYCPQAKFVMFEKSGHNPQVEEPEEEFALIRSFLKE